MVAPRKPKPKATLRKQTPPKARSAAPGAARNSRATGPNRAKAKPRGENPLQTAARHAAGVGNNFRKGVGEAQRQLNNIKLPQHGLQPGKTDPAGYAKARGNPMVTKYGPLTIDRNK